MYVSTSMPANNSDFSTSTFNNITTLGNLAVGGVATITGSLNVTGAITGGSISYTSTSTGTLTIGNLTGTTTIISSTEQSTSVGTGAFKCEGGGSFAGNVHIGGTLTAGAITYATTTTGTLDVTTGTGTTMTIASTTDSTTTTSGSTVFIGGVGIAKKLNAGSVKCWDSTQATSTSTGCLQLVGGLGSLGNIYSGGSLVVTNETSSTTPTTGCAQFSGGVGIVENLNVGGINNFSNTTQSTSVGTGALICGGGGSFAGNVYIGGTMVAGISNQSSLVVSYTSGTTFSVNSTTDSTTTGNGASIIFGGLGVAKRINAGSIKCFDSTAAVSATSGCAQFSGGVGVVGDLYTQGRLVNGGFDFILGNSDQVSRGSSGTSRALVKYLVPGSSTLSELIINFQSDFTQVRVGSDLVVDGTSRTSNFWSETVNASIFYSQKALNILGGTTSIYNTGLRLFQHGAVQSTEYTTSTQNEIFITNSSLTSQVNLTRTGGFYTLNCLVKFRIRPNRTLKFCTVFTSPVKLLSTNGNETSNFKIGTATLHRSDVFGETSKISSVDCILEQYLFGSGAYYVYKMTPVASNIVDPDNIHILSNVGYEVAGDYGGGGREYYIQYQGSVTIPLLATNTTFSSSVTDTSRLTAIA